MGLWVGPRNKRLNHAVERFIFAITEHNATKSIESFECEDNVHGFFFFFFILLVSFIMILPIENRQLIRKTIKVHFSVCVKNC